jgi:hypothetical protein
MSTPTLPWIGAPGLSQMLAGYRPSDAREAEHQRRMLDLIGSPGDAFSRSHYSPGHFTASAFVLSPDESSLLVVLHRKLGRWLQPGGHIDPDDTDFESAAQAGAAKNRRLMDDAS